MTDKEYVKGLGYGDVDRHVFTILAAEDGDEDEIPEFCHILAKWPNGAVTAHFDVENTVLGFFDALDEAGDPSGVCNIWCCDADLASETYLDTDDKPVKWPL